MSFNLDDLAPRRNITPHKRVCGASLLLLVVGIGPHLWFFTGSHGFNSLRAVAMIALVAAYVAIILLPAARRVSLFNSWVVFVSSALVTAVLCGFDAEIKRALSKASNTYGSSAPWLGAQFSGPTQAFEHPLGKYTLRTPESWRMMPGPAEPFRQFVRREGAREVAILRPVCDVDDQPIAVRVQSLADAHPDLQTLCSHSEEWDACLLRRTGADGRGEQWDWLAQRPGSRQAVWLQFSIYDASVEEEAYAIVASTQAAPEGASLPCPVPVEWSAPLPKRGTAPAGARGRHGP